MSTVWLLAILYFGATAVTSKTLEFDSLHQCRQFVEDYREEPLIQIIGQCHPVTKGMEKGERA